MTRFRGALVCAFAMILFSVASTATAQPFDQVFNVTSGHRYLAVAHDSEDLDFGTGFTFEAWVRVTDANGNGGCSSIAGKGYVTSWWIGICGTTLRSYLKGNGSLLDGGKVPADQWTHIAVTYDGITHRHYVDGEEVVARAETGPVLNNTNELRLFSDLNYQFTPKGAIDEVRLWKQALTKEQIRARITSPSTDEELGLYAAWHLDGNGGDSTGVTPNTAVVAGAGTGGFANPFTAGGTCTTANPKLLCLDSGRFEVTASWTAPGNLSGDGTVVPGFSSGSGLFWFFAPDNWELLVKELNGCGLNNRRWVFSAATTNVHYKLKVFDRLSGTARQYFNYQGVSAPAVTDTSAFATCP